MSATDIVAYTYDADNYCPDCIISVLGGISQSRIGYNYSVEGVLDIIAGVMNIDRCDQNSFDSGDFPKVVFESQIEDDEYCGKCEERLV